MARSLSDIIDSAKEDFRSDWLNGNVDLDEPHDNIHEIADGAVPVYHSQLLTIAAENNEVALRSPECGPAYDGTPTPINIIAANIYELVQEALFEYASELRSDLEEKIDNISELSDAELDAEIARVKTEKEHEDYIDALNEAKDEREAEKE